VIHLDEVDISACVNEAARILSVSRYTTGNQLAQDQIGVANQLLPHDHYCAISSDNSTDVEK
jgi:hypothetical protein